MEPGVLGLNSNSAQLRSAIEPHCKNVYDLTRSASNDLPNQRAWATLSAPTGKLENFPLNEALHVFKRGSILKGQSEELPAGSRSVSFSSALLCGIPSVKKVAVATT